MVSAFVAHAAVMDCDLGSGTGVETASLTGRSVSFAVVPQRLHSRGGDISPAVPWPGFYTARAWGVHVMADPEEGVAADGTIRTGARRDRVPAAFGPVLADAVALLGDCGASLYVYGSVANGTVRPGSSDVDLLSIGLPAPAIAGQRLSARYADRCRGVEIAAATAADLAGGTDAAYSYRVFVHLAGPDPAASLPAFLADARAPAVSTGTSAGITGYGGTSWTPGR
jgi:Nucleotidyltransferase domain